METSLFVAFWLVSLSLVMVPGADWAYAIAAGLRDRAIAPAVTGMLLGYLTIIVAVATGIGALVARIPAILTVLTVVGAGYLLWLGGNIFAHPSVPTVADEQVTDTSLKWTIRGFATSGLNPKGLLLLLALLPQFTSRNCPWTISQQIGAMGIVHLGNCAIVYTLVGVGSKIVLRTRPKVARMISQVSGAAMIVIAVLLLVEQSLSFSVSWKARAKVIAAIEPEPQPHWKYMSDIAMYKQANEQPLAGNLTDRWELEHYPAALTRTSDPVESRGIGPPRRRDASLTPDDSINQRS
jgi:threonine/homoserine/homoserine lactone efflux protein